MHVIPAQHSQGTHKTGRLSTSSPTNSCKKTFQQNIMHDGAAGNTVSPNPLYPSSPVHTWYTVYGLTLAQLGSSPPNSPLHPALGYTPTPPERICWAVCGQPEGTSTPGTLGYGTHTLLLASFTSNRKLGGARHCDQTLLYVKGCDYRLSPGTNKCFVTVQTLQ